MSIKINTESNYRLQKNQTIKNNNVFLVQVVPKGVYCSHKLSQYFDNNNFFLVQVMPIVHIHIQIKSH